MEYISFYFALFVNNEEKNYLSKCIDNILLALENNDELIILDDYSTEKSTIDYLNSLNNQAIKIYKHALNNNFSEHKNYLLSLCKKDYIFLFDADEYINAEKIKELKQLVNFMPNVDIFNLPRKNIIENVTDEAIKKYNWNIKNGLFNYPDFQQRIIKNNKGIIFKGNLHERLYNEKSSFNINDEQYAIMHIKTLERQISQHNFYETLK